MNGLGRFSAFSWFMSEKGFVRQLTDQAQTGRLLTRHTNDGVDLLAVGVALVCAMLS